MILPWVSRERYEEQRAAATEWRDLYRELFDLQSDRVPRGTFETLLAQYHELAKPVIAPTQEVTQLAMVPHEKSPIALRIEDVAAGDPKLKRFFWSQVSKWRHEGKSDGDIVGLIRFTSTEDEA